MTVCPGCGREVQKNRVFWKGETWHKACSESDGRTGPPIAHCQGCGSELGHNEIIKTFYPQQSRPAVTCAHCGSSEIIWPKEQDEAEVLV